MTVAGRSEGQYGLVAPQGTCGPRDGRMLATHYNGPLHVAQASALVAPQVPRPRSATFKPLTGGVAAGRACRKLLVVAHKPANSVDEWARSIAQNLRRVAADAQPDVFLIDSQACGTACPRIPCHSASWFKPGAQVRQPCTPAREGHDIDDSPAHWLLGVESEWAGVRLIDGVAEQVARLRQGPPAGLSEFDAARHSELQKLSRDVTTRLALFDAFVPDSTQEAALQTDNSEKEFGTWGRDGAEPTSGWGTAADYAGLYVDRRRSEAFHSKGEAATIAGLMAIEIAIASDFDVTRPDRMLWQSDRLAKRPLTAVEGIRPRADDRPCLLALIYLLREGCTWRRLPTKQLGCASPVTVWRRLREWSAAGVWLRLHQRLLDHLGRAGAVDLRRVVADSASVRALKGGSTPGPTPRTAASAG